MGISTGTRGRLWYTEVMKKKAVSTEEVFSQLLRKVGISQKVFLILLACVAAGGGTYGGYVITRSEAGPSEAEITYMSRVIDGDTFEIGDGKNGASGAWVRRLP